MQSAVERVRAIADPESRMVAAQELMRDLHAAEADLVDIRSQAAKVLRETWGKRVWPFRRIAERCGLTGDHLTQRGRVIWEGRAPGRSRS